MNKTYLEKESLADMNKLKILRWHARFGWALGLPKWFRGKGSAHQCRRHRFNPWVRKIPWWRKWQPISGFLTGKFHGQRSLAGYSSLGCKESDDNNWSIHPSTHPIHLSIWVPNRKLHKGDKRQLTKEIKMPKSLENLNVSRTQEMCIKTLRTASEHGQ